MFNTLSFLTTTGDATVPAIGASGFSIIMLLVMFLFMYLFIIRPQQKQQKKQDELRASVEIGDVILTTSGFYGTVIDIMDENAVIVEFGNNKNCRIPMKKTAILEIDKPNK